MYEETLVGFIEEFIESYYQKLSGDGWKLGSLKGKDERETFHYVYFYAFWVFNWGHIFKKKIKIIPKPSNQGIRTAIDSSTTALVLSPQPPPPLWSGLRTVLCFGTQPPSDGSPPSRRPPRRTLWSTADSTLPRARASGKDPSPWEGPGVPGTQRRALGQPLSLWAQREKCFLKPCCADEAVDLICNSITIHQWTLSL